MTIHIKPEHLKAVAIAASREQARFYICGVCVETYADDSHGLIATDGNQLYSYGADANRTPESSFIISNDDIVKLLSMAALKGGSNGETIAA